MAKRKKRRKPKVFVDEIPGGARPIQAVGTAVAAFVGLVPRSPVRLATTVALIAAVVGIVRSRVNG